MKSFRVARLFFCKGAIDTVFSTMTPLVSHFAQTLANGRISSSERQKLKQLISEQELSNHDLAFLRHKIFDFARTGLSSLSPDQVLSWLEDANKLLVRKGAANLSQEVFFSPGQECLDAIVGRLRNAVRSVDICVFTISDDRISREINFCHQRKIRVRILTDNEKRFDRGSDIEEFERKGIPVRIDKSEKHMHHKFAVIDQKIVLTGSYNWTRSAAQRNEENILVSNHSETVAAYLKEFEDLWDMMREL